MDRTHPRFETPAPAGEPVSCRRPVAPGGPERDPSEAEQELVRAMQEYKNSSGRMFPTWSEVLEVVRGLGYEQAAC